MLDARPRAPRWLALLLTLLCGSTALFRFADIDLFNTSYLRPSTAPGWEDIPWECRAIEKQKGFWTVKERGSKLVWCNSMRLSELWLTTEGAYYLVGDRARLQCVLCAAEMWCAVCVWRDWEWDAVCNVRCSTLRGGVQ